MKTLHPEIMYTPPHGGVQGGVTPPVGSGGAIPSAGGYRGKRGLGEEAPKGKIAL
jgi:hypothetical protein